MCLIVVRRIAFVISVVCLMTATLSLSACGMEVHPTDVTSSGTGDSQDSPEPKKPAVTSDRPVNRVQISDGSLRIDAQEDSDGTLVAFIPAGMSLDEATVTAFDEYGEVTQEWVSPSEDEAGVPADGTHWVTEVIGEEAMGELSAGKVATIWVRQPTPAEPESTRLELMQSTGVRTVAIETSELQSFVEEDKENEASGRICVIDTSGEALYDGKLSRITGRGNFTWSLDKKPFNIKLGEAADLVGTGEPHRSWCLMADAYDLTGLRNLVSLRMAKSLGLGETPDCAPCDVWWNGRYCGSYLLTEKIGVWDGGVVVDSLEDETKRTNKAADETAEAYEHPETETEEGTAGRQICYAAGTVAPSRVAEDDLEGLLVEHDERQEDGNCWFESSIGKFVIKSPDVAPEQLVSAAQERFDRAFSCLYAGGGENEFGCSSTDYFDLDSLARCGWLYAVAGEADYMRLSSSYFFVGSDNLIHAGPAWDFDVAWGNRPKDQVEYNNPDYGNNFEKNVLGNGNEDLKLRISEIHPLLASLVREVALGGIDAVSEDGILRSISYYAKMTESSHRMDRRLWGHSEEECEDAVESLKASMESRTSRADDLVDSWETETSPEDQ